MDETRVKVEMEGGMWFEFSGREEEEQISRPDLRVMVRGVPDPLFKARFIFFDITNPDTNENQQVIGVEESLTRSLIVSRSLKHYFNHILGHGLTTQELSDCVQQFSVVVNHIIAHPSPPANGNGNGYRRRVLYFDVKRRGVLGTRYHARQIEMQEEEVECRNRWNRMVEKGMRPANPSLVDRILGNMDWRKAVAIEDVCPICLEGFRSGEDATRMLCRHCFHSHCIARWFCRSHRCPMCRMPIHRLYYPSVSSGLPNPYN